MKTCPAAFRCSHCGHSQRGELSTGGKSDFMLQFATCPSCKRRGRLRAYVQRNVLLYVGFCAIIFVAGMQHPRVMPVSTQMIVDAMLLVLMVTGAVGVWRKLDRRVRWLDA